MTESLDHLQRCMEKHYNSGLYLEDHELEEYARFFVQYFKQRGFGNYDVPSISDVKRIRDIVASGERLPDIQIQ